MCNKVYNFFFLLELNPVLKQAFPDCACVGCDSWWPNDKKQLESLQPVFPNFMGQINVPLQKSVFHGTLFFRWINSLQNKVYKKGFILGTGLMPR